MNPTMAASNSNRLNNDEWECPVGLTPDYAIAIADDSDSDDQDKDNALHGNDNHNNSMMNDNGRRHVLLDNNNENIDNDGQGGGSDTVPNNGRNNEGTANDNNIGAGVTVKVSSFFSKQDTTSSNSNGHATIGNGDAIIISASCKVEPQCSNNNNDDDEMNMSNDSAALTLIPQQFENNDEYLVDSSSSLLNNKIAGDRDCSTNETTDTDCRTAQIIASDNNHGTTIGETSNNLPDAANDSTADTTIDQNENPSLQEGQSTNIIDETTNPFASFAFQPSVSTAGSFFANNNSSGGNNNNNNHNKNKSTSTSSTRRTIKRPRDDSTNTNTCQLKSSSISTVMNQRLNNNKKENANPFKLHSYSQKKKKYQFTSAKPSTTTITSSENHNPTESLQECIAKWHSFADPMAPMEQQRFQVLIAARLHVKCHETTVMKAMVRLRGHFQDKRQYDDDGSKHDDVDQGEDFKSETVVEVQQQHSSTTPQQQQLSSSVQGLTPHTLANSHAETEIAPLLSSILFGNTKARQIVQASQDILSQFGGTVPESMTGLKQITGIGPKLAEILHLVNGRESYL